MKVLIEPKNKNNLYQNQVDGLILSLKDFSTNSISNYSINEIKQIVEENKNLEIFVNINKNIFNDELEELKTILLELDKLDIKGIMFYDLAFLKLKKDLSLKTDLVWNQTYMVNNYKTCNYYYSQGVKYVFLSKEITIEEINEILKNTKSKTMCEVIGYPKVAYSYRKLITNYYKALNKTPNKKLDVIEKVTNKEYELIEDKNGTSFYLKDLVNGTSIIKDLYENNLDYIIIKEYGIDQEIFKQLLIDTKKYVEGNCLDENYVRKYQLLGDNTNFFFKKTIYQVKKNG